MKNIIKRSLGFMLILLLAIMSVNAATGLNVVLANQNPDPVSPGNFVYLNIKISNIGDTIVENAIISFDENSNFQVANGEEIEKELGSLSAYSTSGNSNSFTVAKYKIYVDENTPSGLNTVHFDVKTSTGKKFSYDFDVLVQDANPQIVVKDILIPQTQPGDSQKLKLVLENPNAINLKNVKVALDLANVEEKVITLDQGSNEFIVGDIDSGKTVDIEYDVIVSPEAESKPYLLPIVITFDDNLENSFENTVYGTVKVYSAPELSLELDSQEVYTVGKGKFSLAIANPGSSKIRGVQVKILPSENYEIIEGENQYVGDLNPDDFQTLQGEVYIQNSEQAVLKVQLNFGDSYDKRTQEVIEVPLKIYNEQELVELGFKGSNQGGGSAVGYIIVAILSVVVTFFFVRRSFSKKLKRRA